MKYQNPKITNVPRERKSIPEVATMFFGYGIAYSLALCTLLGLLTLAVWLMYGILKLIGVAG